MSEDNCTSETCVIHTRTDGIKTYADGEGMVAKVTYVGEYAVLTKVNEVLDSTPARLLRMMGSPADIFYTMVVHVGPEGSVGTYLANEGDTYEPVKFFETHTPDTGVDAFEEDDLTAAESQAVEYHDGIVSALKAETLDLSKGLTREVYVQTLFDSIKKNPFAEGGEGSSFI